MEAEVKTTVANLRRKLISSGEYVRFSQLFSRSSTSDEERVGLAVKYLTDYDLLPFSSDDQPEPSGKSSQAAAELWNSGNRVFMRDNRRALEFYNRSICTAHHHGSEHLALGFANRSAVYYVTRRYEACLRDIERAVTHNYPEKLREKLFQRRRMCLQKMMEKHGDGLESVGLKEDTNHSPLTPLSPDHGQLFITDALALPQPNTESGLYRREQPLPQISYGQHGCLQSASCCLDVDYTSTQGRFLVANRDVDPGDVLIVEKPNCSVLLPDFYLTHCNKCLRRSDAMTPCNTCDSVMYCSTSCRDTAWKVSHSVECWLLPAFRRLDVGQATVFLLPLRMFLVACRDSGGLSGLYQQLGSREERRPPQDLKQAGSYQPLGCSSLSFLCHHRAKEPDFQLAWAVGVGCILNLLESRSDFFESADHDKSTLKSFAGGMLLGNIGITTTNCFSVTEFVVKADERRLDEEAFGDAVYSTMSLLNHSCNPNALNSFHRGDINVLMAKKPIKKGEQVCISYGGSFAHRERSVRQHELRMNYHFECRCEACAQHWPMFNDLQPISSPSFVCRGCRAPLPDRKSVVTCPACKRRHDLQEMMEEVRCLQDKITAVYDELKTGSTEDFKQDMAEVVKTVARTVVSPCQLAVAAQQYLRYSLKVTGNHVIQ